MPVKGKVKGKTSVSSSKKVSKKSNVSSVNKKVSRSKVSKSVEFDLTLPEPPMPPKQQLVTNKAPQVEQKKSGLFSFTKSKQFEVELPKPLPIQEPVEVLQQPKRVVLHDSDVKFPSNFKPKMVEIFSDKKKKSLDKQKEIEGEYKKHLDNHVKVAKLEIGKSHPDLKEKIHLSAQDIINSVVVDKTPKVTAKVRREIDTIVQAKKTSDTKADLIKETFKTNIQDQIKSLEFNVVFKISDTQPFFDELTSLQKTVAREEIPSPKDFGISTTTNVESDKKPTGNFLSSIFKKFLTSDEKSVIESFVPKPIPESINEPKVDEPNPKIEVPNSDFAVNSVSSDEDLDTFFKNEEKRVSAYKLVVPREKVIEESQKRKTLDEHEQELSKREIDLVRQKELHDREREDFDNHKSNVDLGHKEIQEYLESETKKLDIRKQELLDKEEDLKKRTEDIARQESEVKRILEKEVELNDLRITLETKDSELKKKESSISRRESTLDEKIRRNELLKAELDRHKKLSILETQMSKKETSLGEHSAKLSEKENFLKLKEDELKILKKEVQDKERLLNQKLLSFKKDKTLELEKREAKLLELQEQLDNREKDLKHYEEGLNISKSEVRKEAERLEDAEFNMLVDEQKMKDTVGGVSDQYVKFDNLDKLDQIMDMPELQQAELYRLVSRCREVLRQRNFDQAKNLYNQIKERYAKLDADEEEKQIIYNTIRELYDDIKLAMLY